MQSLNKIKSLINTIDNKLGSKCINLSGAVNILCNGFNSVKGTTYTPITSNSVVQSCKRVCEILDKANKTTGYNDGNVTSAVQRLCNGYSEQAPLYSFGVISDLHIQYVTGLDDFARALTYLRTRVPFTCVCGDLVSFADSTNMAQYKSYVATYKGSMNVYECSGNHESYPSLGVGANIDETLWTNTTGKQLYYSFTHGNDVFIMFGMKSERANDLFPSGALDWLQTTLEANKTKRCFVFQHAPELADRGADPSGTWSSLMGGTSGKAFVNIIKQYRNVVWFHGHTHVTLGVEQYPVSDVLGYRSVHIPSLVSPRFYMPEVSNTLTDSYIDENNNTVWGSTLSEGYIVDVYENKIVLRGINFASGTNKDEVMPFVNEVYALDTTF